MDRPKAEPSEEKRALPTVTKQRARPTFGKRAHVGACSSKSPAKSARSAPIALQPREQPPAQAPAPDHVAVPSSTASAPRGRVPVLKPRTAVNAIKGSNPRVPGSASHAVAAARTPALPILKPVLKQQGSKANATPGNKPARRIGVTFAATVPPEAEAATPAATSADAPRNDVLTSAACDAIRSSAAGAAAQQTPKAAPRQRAKAADVDGAAVAARVAGDPSLAAVAKLTIPELKCYLRVRRSGCLIASCMMLRRLQRSSCHAIWGCVHNNAASSKLDERWITVMCTYWLHVTHVILFGLACGGAATHACSGRYWLQSLNTTTYTTDPVTRSYHDCPSPIRITRRSNHPFSWPGSAPAGAQAAGEGKKGRAGRAHCAASRSSAYTCRHVIDR